MQVLKIDGRLLGDAQFGVLAQVLFVQFGVLMQALLLGVVFGMLIAALVTLRAQFCEIDGGCCMQFGVVGQVLFWVAV